MDDIPSLSSGGVGSRFISQTDLDAAKKRRDEQWKAAYARLGQEPPERPQEDVYDGRSLAEKLASNRAQQQEEWEQKMKLSNQFRSLEEDEVVFLDSIMEKQLEEERKRNEEDGEEVRSFREAVAARKIESSKPTLATTSKTRSSLGKTPGDRSVATKPKFSGGKMDKDRLKGIIVKKKNNSVKETPVTKQGTATSQDSQPTGSSENREPKRRRLAEPE